MVVSCFCGKMEKSIKENNISQERDERIYKTNDVLVIVPVFNEFNNINKVVNELTSYFENIIFVDDGSSDNSFNLIKNLGLITINHLFNLGQGAALESGFEYFLRNTNYRYAITFDGDGQNRVSDAFKMLNLAKKEKLDAVIGSRFLNKEYVKDIPFLKKLVLKMARIYEKIFYSINFSDAHNGLRVLRRELIRDFLLPIKNHDMSHATEISYKICKSKCLYKEFPILVKYNNKRTQNALNSINIIIKNIFNPFKN